MPDSDVYWQMIEFYGLGTGQRKWHQLQCWLTSALVVDRTTANIDKLKDLALISLAALPYKAACALRPSVRLSVRLSRARAVYWTCSHTIVCVQSTFVKLWLKFLFKFVNFMPPQSMLQQRHYVFVLCLSASLPCHRHFFRFVRILHRFRWNLRDVFTTTNRLNDYILSEIGTRPREQDTTEYSNRRQSVCHDVKQVLTPSEWIHKFNCTDCGWRDCGHNSTLI